MRIVIDIDGTVCEIRKPGQSYADVKLLPGAAEKLQALKKKGHYLILSTARHMKTCNGDVEMVMARVGDVTEQWLKNHNVPYDELHYGKPYADVYIDDKAHYFSGWDQIHTESLSADHAWVVIPMAGLGSRFKNAGYSKPKPLIDVLGKPMIEWAVQSFDFLSKLKSYSLLFIILEEDDRHHNLTEELRARFGPQHPTEILTLPHVTRGQMETVLAAKKHVNSHNKLFIYNCDTYSRAPIWELIEQDDPDGILPYFYAADERYSYMRFDEYGHVVETAEKKVISEYASTGLYYFKHGRDFVMAAERSLTEDAASVGEFYIAPLYNSLIRQGKRIRGTPVTEHHVLGTPEELVNFLAQQEDLD